MHRSVRGAHRRGELLPWSLLGRDGPVGVALRNESGVGSRGGSADARRRMQGARRRGGRLLRNLFARRQRRAAGRHRRESRGAFGDAVGSRQWVDRGGVLGAVDQIGLALALDLAERGGGRPLVDALRVGETGSIWVPHVGLPCPRNTPMCGENLTAGASFSAGGDSLAETVRSASPYVQ